MSDRFLAPSAASIFNLKRLHNALADAVAATNVKNLLGNPELKTTRFGLATKWSTVGVNLDAPISLDEINRRILSFNTGDKFSQSVALVAQRMHTLVIADTLIDSTAFQVNVRVADSTNSVYDSNNVGGQSITFSIADLSDLHVMRFKGISPDESPVSVIVEVEALGTLNMSVGSISLYDSEIAFRKNNSFLVENSIRWNDATGVEGWEITTDDGVTWSKLWIDDAAFEAKVQEYVAGATAHLVHQDNIIAGAGITITPGNDGTNPTLTIATGAGGGGSGDWTREDVAYQSLLEHSDFEYCSYNTMAIEAFTLDGGASFNPGSSEYGVGFVQGLAGSNFTTNDLITDGSNHSSFYVHAVNDGTIVCEYATSIDGTTWGSFTGCAINEVVNAPAPFNHLKVKFTFAGGGTIKVHSYGILYGVKISSATSSVGFKEAYDHTGADSTSTTITIPNEKWYHRDGKSLSVYHNGKKLNSSEYVEIEHIDRTDISNEVEIKVLLTAGDVVEFDEYYGYVDVSNENSQAIIVLDASIGAIDAMLVAHVDQTDAHGAKNTADANTIALRDATGNIQVGLNPINDADAASKKFVVDSVSADISLRARGWVSFSGIAVATPITYVRNALDATINFVAHTFIVGNRFYLSTTTGTLPSGWYNITSISTNSFVVSVGVNGTGSGAGNIYICPINSKVGLINNIIKKPYASATEEFFLNFNTLIPGGNFMSLVTGTPFANISNQYINYLSINQYSYHAGGLMMFTPSMISANQMTVGNVAIFHL